MLLPSRLELESKIFAIIKTMQDLYEKAESAQISTTFYQSSIQQKIHEIYLMEFISKKKNMDLDKIINEMKIGDQFQDVITKLRSSLLLKTPIQTKTIIKEPTEQNKVVSKGKKTSSKTEPEKVVTGASKTKKTSISSNTIYRSEAPAVSDSSKTYETSSETGSSDISTMEKIVSSSTAPNNLNNDITVNSKSFNPMALAKISADITSDFITIIDFFHIKLVEFIVLFEISEKLRKNLILFPGMDELCVDLSMFFKDIMWIRDAGDINKNTRSKANGQIKIENDSISLINPSGSIIKQIGYAALGKNFELLYLKFKKNMIIQIGK
jgi:hypothetical protein